ncbi:hypothetical protein TWF730_003701 [Orbilia blumenaviensis]|uniref:Uncharacterized protein n=1 Tax=Orbilia blumenaviensis TaxID=1796055 RepID=A0AAV9U3T7_9PEZI
MPFNNNPAVEMHGSKDTNTAGQGHTNESVNQAHPRQMHEAKNTDTTDHGHMDESVDQAHGHPTCGVHTNLRRPIYGHRSVCMACGRPVNPAHGICDCGVQNGKPNGKNNRSSGSKGLE